MSERKRICIIPNEGTLYQCVVCKDILFTNRNEPPKLCQCTEKIPTCPSCGKDDPLDNVLEEVDIGVGVQKHYCEDAFHDPVWKRRT